MAPLAQAHRVIAYDRRFGGQSNSPLVVQTWDMVCQDVIDLMDALGIEQAYLGGGSFGAAISLAVRCATRSACGRFFRPTLLAA
jgi:pimeloyl-ACP methyl ester carboxylesterase